MRTISDGIAEREKDHMTHQESLRKNGWFHCLSTYRQTYLINLQQQARPSRCTAPRMPQGGSRSMKDSPCSCTLPCHLDPMNSKPIWNYLARVQHMPFLCPHITGLTSYGCPKVIRHHRVFILTGIAQQSSQTHPCLYP